jgi:predicted dehydrogenase
MSSETIRIGIIGAGGNTRARHIPGLQAIDGVEIAGVSNRSRASSEKVARDFGIPRVYASWTALIAEPEIDAVVIGTWPYLHAPATLAALAAGKHVLCEARMAMDAREARAMRDAARAKPHLVAQLVPSPFTLGVDAEVRQRIAAGYLGDILAIKVRDGNTFLDREAPLHWRQDAGLSGVNVLTLGIWYEALLRWAGEATRVMAMGKTFQTMRRDAGGLLQAVRVPEHVDVIADMACGAQAHLQFSAVTGLAGPSEAFLFGSEGTLRFANNTLYGARRGDREPREIPIPPEREGHWRVEEEFINAIRGVEAITHTTFDQGVQYMEFTEAVARSIASGKAVPLPLTT